jgi:PAS domain S-box-containing protein
MIDPADEARRIEALQAYGVLDTPPELELDRLTDLLASLCAAPIAFISLIDSQRQWFKSLHGATWTATARAVAFCDHAIAQAGLFVVADAAQDPRFADNPLVTGSEALRFYASVPLLTPAGHALGTLAVMDRVPRGLDALQQQALTTLAGQVMVNLESRRRQVQLEDALLQREHGQAALRDSQGRWHMLFERNPLPMWIFDVQTLAFLAVNEAAVQQYGWSQDEFRTLTLRDIRPPEDVPALLDDIGQGHAGLHGGQLWRHRRKNGDLLWVDITAHSIEFGGRSARLILAHDVSARVQAMQAVHASQQRWESMFAASAIGIASADLDGCFVSVNPAFCTLLGRPAAELLGCPLLGFTHPLDVANCEAGLRRLADGEIESLTVEKRYLRPDGQAVWARAVVTLTPAAEAATQAERRLVAVVQDIDAQHAAEDALRRNGALIEVAGRLARLGGWAVDLPHMGVRWSDELRLILDVPSGQTPSAAEAIAWYVGESRQRIEQALQACLEQGTPFDLDMEMVTPKGRALSVRAIGQPMLDASGRIIGACGGLLDQTVHKATEAALRGSEERFRNVARATADAIWDWNLADDSRWWSDGLHSLFGHAAADLAPGIQSWLDLIHPDDLQRVEDSIRTSIAGTAKSWTAEYRLRRSSGEHARVVDRGFIIRDATARAVRMVGGITDLTQRYALEAQLQQAQRLEAVGQLTGGVAHDFNNLLTVILGNAELLAEQLQGQPDLQSMVLMSRSAAERGAELTQRLLAFSRKQALQPQAVDAHQLLAGMDALLRRTLPENIELELVRGAGLWAALADPAQLESALLNLVLNARDAMPDGGRLTLETANAWIDQAYADQHAEVLPGQYVLLSVSDTGTGMSQQQLARAFEPFYTTKPTGKGSGLGLSMVYGYARQSRGHVKIYSELGHGSTVRLYLPRADAAAAALDARAASAVSHVASHVDHALRGSATVLVVEDDDLVRRHAADLLTSLGYIVLVAEHGAAAMAVLRSRSDIALLFTDVVMPGGMNGNQLAQAARALHPGLKVLYTSGYTENAIVHHGRLDRGVHLLPKPYRSVELARKLRLLLDAAP